MQWRDGKYLGAGDVSDQPRPRRLEAHLALQLLLLLHVAVRLMRRPIPETSLSEWKHESSKIKTSQAKEEDERAAPLLTFLRAIANETATAALLRSFISTNCALQIPTRSDIRQVPHIGEVGSIKGDAEQSSANDIVLAALHKEGRVEFCEIDIGKIGFGEGRREEIGPDLGEEGEVSRGKGLELGEVDFGRLKELA